MPSSLLSAPLHLAILHQSLLELIYLFSVDRNISNNGERAKQCCGYNCTAFE